MMGLLQIEISNYNNVQYGFRDINFLQNSEKRNFSMVSLCLEIAKSFSNSFWNASSSSLFPFRQFL